MLDALEKIIGPHRVSTIINTTKTPNILKVRANIESNPTYKAWISSDEYKKLSVNSAGFVKDHHPELVPSTWERRWKRVLEVRLYWTDY